MPHKLENLKITKVDFVTEGANPDADIGLTKSRSDVQKGEGEAQTFGETLQEREHRREMDRVADDMWNVCYALNDSFCSILFDESMDAEQRREAMLKSLDEFTATIKEAVSDWSGGQPVGYVVKANDAMEALTREKKERKNLPICGGLCDNNEVKAIIFSHRDAKEGGFSHEEEGNAERSQRASGQSASGRGTGQGYPPFFS